MSHIRHNMWRNDLHDRAALYSSVKFHFSLDFLHILHLILILMIYCLCFSAQHNKHAGGYKGTAHSS